MWVLFFLLTQLKVVTKNPEVVVKLQVTVKENYYLVTKNTPLRFDVEGPTWVRVYLRIPWKREFRGPQIGKLILVTDESEERFIKRDFEFSKASKIGDVRVSRWRSFYIKVPEGRHSYELHLWRAPVESLFVRLAFESPALFVDVAPSEYAGIWELIENEKILKYYEVKPAKPLLLEIDGPVKLKVICRVPLKTLEKSLTYTLSVKEDNKKIKDVTYTVSPSDIVRFRAHSDIFPSEPKVFYIYLKKGRHRVEFDIIGVESGFLRFQVQGK